MYDQTFDLSFQQKKKTIQYNPALPITGAIRGFSREKLYQELGLEIFQQRRWYRKICCFHKILYLYSIIPTHNMCYRGRLCNKIPAKTVKHDFFKYSFFPSTMIEWNKWISILKSLKVLKLLKKEFYHSWDRLLIAYSIAITLKE